MIGVSVAVAVGMYFVGKIASGNIHPGDTGKFVLASLFVVPSIGLLVGFVELTMTSRGWRRAVAVGGVVLASLLVAVMVLFIAVGVALVSSGFDGFWHAAPAGWSALLAGRVNTPPITAHMGGC